jgi:hypothetical protein
MTKNITLVLCLAALAAVGFGQETATDQVDQLKAQIREQQRQIDQLQSSLAKEQQLLDKLDTKPVKQSTNDQGDKKIQRAEPAQSPTPSEEPRPQAAATSPVSPSPVLPASAPAIAPAAAAAPSQSATATASQPPGSSHSILADFHQPLSLQPDTTPSPGARAVPDTQLSDSIQFAQGKFRVGALLYADWADYYKTGFGPQFLTQINPLGAGNNGYNTFEVNRTYLNLYFSPNDNITFRLTPNIYRQFAGVSAVKYGAVTGIGASANENLTFRLKYAYVDLKNFFGGAAKGVTLSLGQTQNPLVDWEENLWSYRYIALTPWNYLSLSSTQTGIKLHGPLKGSNGKTYFDFDAGIFTQASFHAYEQAESKQIMVRGTFYPFGSAGSYQGLGITGFYDSARTNVTPDTAAAKNIGVYRGVAMVHWATKNNMSNIAFEFDFGRNAFGSGNLFSGSGPLDQYGLGTTMYAGMDSVVKAFQGTDRTKQIGYNVFGHLQLGKSPFQLFGWFENFQPNTEDGPNPADFNRIIGGIQYRANKSLRFALDSQNVIYYSSQSTVPASQLSYFSSSLAAANPNGISNAVPPDIQAVFINMEFSF